MIVPMLAVAGSLARKKMVAAVTGNISRNDASLHGSLSQRNSDRRSADIFSGAQSGTVGRAFVDVCRKDILMVSDKLQFVVYAPKQELR